MSPFPGENSVIVLDNAIVHHSYELSDACADAGVMLIFLPPYCPFWNPVELVFAQVKCFLRRHAPEFHRTFGFSAENDARLLTVALDQVLPRHCAAYFRKCVG